MDENLNVPAEERAMFDLLKSLFSTPEMRITVRSRTLELHALHIDFDSSFASNRRGAALTSEEPERIREILAFVDRLKNPCVVQIHHAHRAPLSPRALGLWLVSIAECRNLVVVVIDPDADVRASLETARRRGCTICGL